MTARRARRRVPRWTYLVAGAAALALLSGYTIGAITLGGFGSVPHQATATSLAPVPPVGVSFPLAEAGLPGAKAMPAAGACTASNLGTQNSPAALVNGKNTTICLTNSAGGFANGDLLYILDVSFDPTAPTATVFEVQVFLAVTPTANDLVDTAFVNTTVAISSTEVATFAADLTQSSDTSLDGFTVIVTQLNALP
jgi:hypothetical protein